MKMKVTGFLAVMALSGLVLYGCGRGGTPPAANSAQAVQTSKTIESKPDQINYLLGQATHFLDSKEYQQALDTANYILTKLDSNSDSAKTVVMKAKSGLQKTAQSAVTDIKKKLGATGQ
jgi:hypothetical protein